MPTIGSFFLNMNKPRGVSSRHVVDVISKTLQERRCGHAGTLDPLATGVLVVGVGKATRLVEFVQRLPKVYVARFRLGCTSDTDDSEGELIHCDVPIPPTFEQIRTALKPFVGNIMQRPPAHSAVKIDGKRSYELARNGKAIDLAPRPVTVYDIELLEYSFPELTLHIRCGSGTYIRAIARDLGESLAMGGVMVDLRRTVVGEFAIENALPLDAITSGEWIHHRLPLSDAVTSLTPVRLDRVTLRKFNQGQRIAVPEDWGPGHNFAAFDPDNRLTGIGRVVHSGVGRCQKGGFV